jgi:hypothetical protein
MKYILTILSILLLASCNVEKKAQKKVGWLLAHDLMDDNCARLYPNRDSSFVRDTVIRRDTITGQPFIIRDTVPCPGGKETILYRYHECPPVRTIIEYHTRDSIIYRTNTAEVERMKGEVLGKEKQLREKDDLIIKKDAKIDKNDWWKWACLITWMVMLLSIIFRLFIYKKPI